METPKHETPEHFEAEVANYIQLGLLRRYLEKELGTDYVTHERKTELESKWIKEYAPKFRSLFNENKATFLQFYKENREGLIEEAEELLEKDEGDSR